MEIGIFTASSVYGPLLPLREVFAYTHKSPQNLTTASHL